MFGAWSCQDDDKIEVDPSNAVAPIITNPEAIPASAVFSSNAAASKFATVYYKAADFKIQAPVTYRMGFTFANDKSATKYPIGTSSAYSDSIVLSVGQLNQAIYDIIQKGDTSVDVYLSVWAQLSTTTTKGILMSDMIKTTITTYEPPKSLNSDDRKSFTYCYVIGSFGANFGNSWTFDDGTWSLFDYSGDGNYKGLIDFGKKHDANAFKLTDAGNWNNGNFGATVDDLTAETDKVDLMNDGGSKNIGCYTANRFYHFIFNKSALTIAKDMAFNKVGIIGLAGNWNDDILMNYNENQRFFADIEVTDATQFKFRLDGAWTTNWGKDDNGDGSLDQGGSNIDIAKGNYRVYLNLNNLDAVTYELSTTDYGTDFDSKYKFTEGGGDEPVVAQVWSIIGAVSGSNWDKDFVMTDNGSGVWSYRKLVVNDGDQFKLRFASAWDTNRGGAFESVGKAIAVTNNGDNFTGMPAGNYDVVYDSKAETVTISTYVPGWSLIGAIAGSTWDKDFDMTNDGNGVWTSKAVVIDGEFKIRYDYAWDVNFGGVLANVGEAFTAVSGGDNIKVPTTGKEYVVVYDSNKGTITVNEAKPANQWSIIGNNNDWNTDVYMTQLSTGLWVSGVVDITSAFKIRYNNGWDINRGGSCLAISVPFGVTNGGDNITVTPGKYQIVYNPMVETITLNPTDSWGVVGNIESTSWDFDLFMRNPGTGIFKSEMFRLYGDNAKTYGCQIRLGGTWSVQWGGTLVAVDTPFAAGTGNIIPPKDGAVYTLTYNSNNATMTLNGVWCVIGKVEGSSWDKDFYMTEVEDGLWKSAPLQVDGEFKIRQSENWDVNRGGTFAADGTAFDVTAGGVNIAPAAGLYQIVYNSKTEQITVTTVTK